MTEDFSYSNSSALEDRKGTVIGFQKLERCSDICEIPFLHYHHWLNRQCFTLRT